MSMLATAGARCLTQEQTASLTGSCILSVDQTAEGCPNIFAQFRHIKLHTVLLHASTLKRTCMSSLRGSYHKEDSQIMLRQWSCCKDSDQDLLGKATEAEGVHRDC